MTYSSTSAAGAHDGADVRLDGLDARHLRELRASGIADETIAASGIYSEHGAKKIAKLGGLGAAKTWEDNDGAHLPALVIPFRMPDDPAVAFYRVKPLAPMTSKDGKPQKYKQPWRVPPRLYLPPRLRDAAIRFDAAIPLLVTEGEKKALSAESHGYACVAVCGVNMWSAPGTKPRELHADWRHFILGGRDVFVVYDGDADTNGDVRREEELLLDRLHKAGAKPHRVRLPGGSKLDDFLVAHGREAFDALLASSPAWTPDDRAGAVRGAVAGGRPLAGIYEACPTAPSLGGLSDAVLVPYGWQVDTTGVYSDEGVRVLDRPIYIASTIVGPAGHMLEVGWRRKTRTGERYERRTVPRTVIADRRAVVETLVSYGAPIDGDSVAGASKWLAALDKGNEGRIPVRTLTSQCGWQGNVRAFYLGTQGYGDEADAFRMEPQALMSAIQPSGDLDEQIALLRLTIERSPSAATLIFAALATPLLRPLRAPSFGLHEYGESSGGKTTSVQIAIGIYGSPTTAKGGLVASWDATDKAIPARASVLCDLPLALDEVGARAMHDGKIGSVIYTITSGTDRARLTRDAKLRESAEWRTIILSTGEKPLVSGDEATGAQARVLQFACPGDLAPSGREVFEMKSRALRHFGHVGAQWIERVAAVADWRPIEAMLDEERIRLVDMCDGSQLSQRRAEYLAILVVAERLATSWLGLGRDGDVTRGFLTAAQGHVEVVPEHVRAARELVTWVQSQPFAWPRLVRASGGGKVVPDDQRTEYVRAGYRDEASGGEQLVLIPGIVSERLRDKNLALDLALSKWAAEGVALRDGRSLKVKRTIGGDEDRYPVLRWDALKALADGRESDADAGATSGAGNPAQRQVESGALPTTPTLPTPETGSRGDVSTNASTNEPHVGLVVECVGSVGRGSLSIEEDREKPLPTPVPTRSQHAPDVGGDEEHGDFYDPPAPPSRRYSWSR